MAHRDTCWNFSDLKSLRNIQRANAFCWKNLVEMFLRNMLNSSYYGVASPHGTPRWDNKSVRRTKNYIHPVPPAPGPLSGLEGPWSPWSQRRRAHDLQTCQPGELEPPKAGLIGKTHRISLKKYFHTVL